MPTPSTIRTPVAAAAKRYLPTVIASAAFTGAGTMHFVKPDFFEAIVPDWFPSAKLANYGSGALEIMLGLALLVPSSRKRAALGLMALTVAVFPANIDMAANNVEVKPGEAGMVRSVGTATGAAKVINFVRLPMQFPMLAGLWKVFRSAP